MSYTFYLALRDDFLHKQFGDRMDAVSFIYPESFPCCALRISFRKITNMAFFDPDFEQHKSGKNKGILACVVEDVNTGEKVSGFTVCAVTEDKFEIEDYLGLALKRALAYTILSRKSKRLLQDALKSQIRKERFGKTKRSFSG